MSLDFDFHFDQITTLKELEPDRLFVTLTFARHRRGRVIHAIRRRTKDPFRSLTYFGTKVSSFPSEKVVPVTAL